MCREHLEDGGSPSGGQVAAHKSLWAHQWILIRVRDKAEVPAVGRVVKAG